MGRLSFDRNHNILYNRQRVGRITRILEVDIWAGTAYHNGQWVERRAKSKHDLLCEMRKAFGLYESVTTKGEVSWSVH